MPGTFKIKWLNRLNVESNRGASASAASLAASLRPDPVSRLDGRSCHARSGGDGCTTGRGMDVGEGRHLLYTPEVP